MKARLLSLIVLIGLILALTSWFSSSADNIDATWSRNVLVNGDLEAADLATPALTVDAQGNAHALWIANDGGHRNLYYATRQKDGAWETAQRVNDQNGSISGSGSQSVDIAVDQNGRVFAVWVDTRNGNDDIYFAHAPHSGPWSAAQKLNDDAGAEFQGHPTLAVDSQGKVYVAWFDNRVDMPGVLTHIYLATRQPNGTWGANELVTDLTYPTYRFDPDLETDGSDTLHLLYHMYTSAEYQGVYRQRPAGGVWSELEAAAWFILGTGNPKLAVGQNGDAYSVFEINDVVECDHRVPGTPPRWNSCAPIPDICCSAQWPDAVVDDSGILHVVWSDARSGNRDIYYATYDGSVWSDTSRLNDDGGDLAQNQPAIAADSGRTLNAVWHDKRSGDDIYYSTTGYVPLPAMGVAGMTKELNPVVGFSPLPGVSVNSNPGGGSAVTDQDGEYTLPLAAGTYDVSFNMAGYIPATKEGVVVEQDELTEVNMPMVLEGCWPADQVCANEAWNVIPVISIFTSEVSGFFNTWCEMEDRFTKGDPLGAATLFIPGVIDVIDIPVLGDAVDVLEGLFSCIEAVAYDSLEDCGIGCQKEFSKYLWSRILLAHGGPAMSIMVEWLPEVQGSAYSVDSSSPPFELHVYDSQGNHLGKSGADLEHSIPHSYLFQDDGRFFIAPIARAADSYRIVIVGLGEGQLNLTINNPSSHSSAEMARYDALVTGASSNTTLNVSSAPGDLTAEVDSNGDGSTDYTVQPDWVEPLSVDTVFLPTIKR